MTKKIIKSLKGSELTNRGFVIRKSKIDEETLSEIKERLTVQPYLGDYGDDNIDNSFEVFTEDKKTITVPRYYGLKRFGQPEKNSLNGKTCDFDFTGKLREYQLEIVDKCKKAILEKGGGLLSVGCGRGKTVMAIYLAHLLKAKTLVVVHKTFLQDQWVERIKQFTNARIGEIRQDKVDVEDKDIVIAMIQSISMRDYDLSIFNDFKFVIYDEAHHCASKKFSQALYKTGANYTLALSATPDRSDGLQKIMYWYLGKTIYKEEKRKNKQVLANVFKFHINNKLFKEVKQWTKGEMKASVPIMTNNLVQIDERNKHILDIIKRLRDFPKRKILVLSGRREHLEYLKRLTDKQIKIDIDNGKILENECKTHFYVGKMKKYERKEAEDNADILFGTYDMAHEGLDIDRLNTVILATPKKNIIQSVGRVMRKILEAGDIRPLIIDICDELSIFKRHGEKRREDYKQSKFKTKIYHMIGDKIVSRKDYLKETNKFTDDELKDILKEGDDKIHKLCDIIDDDKDENKISKEDNDEDDEESLGDNEIGEKEDNVIEVSGFDDCLF